MREDVQPAHEGRGRPSSDTTRGDLDGPGVLAVQLSELARHLEDLTDVQGTLDGIARAAVETIPGAEHASLSTILTRRDIITRAATDELPRAVDRAQYEFAQGPCVDTLYRQKTVRMSDARSEDRWPEFLERIREMGVASMLAVQLFVDRDDLGALNLFSSEVDAFDDESEHVALLFASHAAVGMANAQHQEHLRAAVSSRDLIGQAKGILMERYKITSDQAFRLIVRASQQTNRKVRDIAEELTGTGSLAGGKRRDDPS